MDALEYAKLAANTIMKKFRPEELPPTHRFHYHQGVFLTGIERLYELTGDEKYSNYIKQWVDFNIAPDGNAPGCHLTEFDDMQPGMLLFRLYRETGDKRYKRLLDKIADAIESHPTNALGGVWHKLGMKHQMWLDTMYMLGVVAAMYAEEFDRPYLYKKVYTQFRLMRDHMTDPITGLMYHVWDDSRRCIYVDKKTGLSSTFWGRAIGWYAAGAAEVLEHMPKDHPYRNEFIETLLKLLNSVVKYQDEKTGLWYQVIDKGDDERNWTETSCSSLFIYAMAKAKRLGLVDNEFDESIRRGFEGVLTKTVNRGDALDITGVCIGTGVGTLEEYFTRPTVENDLHGTGAFLLMCTELCRYFT